MNKVEAELPNGAPAAAKAAVIEEVDFKEAHIEAMCKFADLDLIAKANFKFAIDSMYGSGRGVISRIFTERGISHIAIRQEVNPLFPGINPEPIEPHIELLRTTVAKEKCHAGSIRNSAQTCSSSDRFSGLLDGQHIRLR